MRDEFYFLAALILAHRAFCAAAIFLRAAADTLRFGFSTAAVFFTDTPWPVSAPNNAKTCCSLPISALTSLTIFSTLKLCSPLSPDATGQDSTFLHEPPPLQSSKSNHPLIIIPSQGPVESSESAHHAKKITTVEIPWQAPTRN